MATYKSPVGIPRRTEASAAPSQNAQSTRIPTRSITPTTARSTPAQSQIPRGPRKGAAREGPPPSSEKKINAAKAASERLEERSVPRREQQRMQPQSQVPSDQKANRFLRQPASRLPKFDVVTNTRTPSLVSGSSASTVDSPRSLRRKPSSIGRPQPPPIRTRRDSSSSIEDSPSSAIMQKPYGDPFAETVLGISLPPSSTIYASAGPETGNSADISDYPFNYDNFHPQNFQVPQTHTPSTLYSASPSTFSHISTSTSLSSQSPGTALSQKSGPRTRQMSPLQSKPPITRRPTDTTNLRNVKALSAVRESSTSSSSASTVRNDDAKKTKEARAVAPPALSFSNGIMTSAVPLEPIVVKAQEPEKKLDQETAAPKAVPPEFAHLAVEPSKPRTQPRIPLRPSRDGASDISSFREPSPIIQSNLAYLPTHRRQSSSGSRPNLTSPVSAASSQEHIPTLAKPPSSRGPSPNPNGIHRYGFNTTRIPTSRGPTPDFNSDSESGSRMNKSATAPSPSKSPRFGFLGRRTKTDPTPAATKPEKKLRKGPAAGTGHEKYGRYATRGRSGSTSSTVGSVGRSTSADSNPASFQRTPSSRKSSITSNSGTEVDEFFRDRLTPVILRGNGSGSDLCKSPEDFRSTTSLDSARSAMSPDLHQVSSVASSISEAENSHSRPTLLPSAMTDRVASPKKRFGLGIRRPSESDDDRKRSQVRATLKKRSSFRKSQALNDAAGAGPKVDDISEGKEGNWLKPKSSASQPKPSRRWNFFQRAQAAPKTEELVSDAASIHRAPSLRAPSRSIAHYAVVNAEDDLKMEDIEKLMEEANEDTDGEALHDAEPEEEVEPAPRAGKDYIHSVLLPSPPPFTAELTQPRSMSPKVMLRKDSDAERVSFEQSNDRPSMERPSGFAIQQQYTETIVNKPESGSKPRPSRLALTQVGRIPQVISQRERDRRLPNQSFSRPFAPSHPSPAVHVPSTSIDSISPPILAECRALPTGDSAFSSFSGQLNGNAPSPPKSIETGETKEEFLAFPARKDSEISYSSSSGKWSIPLSTAIRPKPGSPLTEDEVWKEYDDLIDDVLSPSQVDSGCCSSTGTPLFDTVFWKPEIDSNLPGEEYTIEIRKKATLEDLTSPGATTSFHLRRSRLLSILNAPSPSSVTSFPPNVQGDGPINIVDPVTGRLSLPSARGSTGSARPRSSLPASAGSGVRNSRSTTASDNGSRLSNRYRDTRLIEMAETQNDGLVSMANLRFGALMTSKWLSFGRVLFSPIHSELKDINEDRVLVVDGLGKDWSYYCALTYPEAMIYNLGPSESESNKPSGAWSTLPNHRHVHLASPTSAFPFPKGFFAAVVYRFPPSSPEATYKSAISECKRVLRPGGFLEVSVLDLDLINMGNRSRKAIRSLKVQMQAAEPAVCLRPTSDLIMGLVGKRGFENLNRCIVGVPVAAGRLRSGSCSSSNGSVRSDQARLVNNAKASYGSANAFTYTDLLNTSASDDTSNSSEADANITDMVAQVGRWWYSRCHEADVLPDGDVNKSLWKDRGLLQECEKQGTSFRLLIAFAQKPSCSVRRTVSV